MKKLFKTLPALGLALAATMAFAFNMPENQPKFGTPDDGDTWYDVTNIDPGPESYQCVASGVCLRSAPDMEAPQVDSGQFVLTGSLDPIR
ncbi:hypothetical protein [Litoribacter populi]|uniref:hypothetical protein n=1 Tax=Litoribacter populi TaxID=2598460 RepID=UPI0011802B92|nr:hypothetical protein [Litoribacter populi]